MKYKINLLFLTGFIISFAFSQSPAYEYKVKIKGMEDTVIYFGHHYGDKQYVIDTVKTNEKGEAVISGNENLPGGMYLIVMPKIKNKYFELIVNEPKFSIETDTLDFVKNMKITGSLENKIFYDDLNFIDEKRKEAEPLKEQLKTLDKNSDEAKKIKDALEKINKDVEDERSMIGEKYPNSFYAKFIKSVQDVKIPDAPRNADGTKDSTFAYRYVRQHYFDNIDFSDERFLRTNVLSSKIDKYISTYVPKIPDSVSVAVDFIVNKARANKEVFKFVVVTLLNEYANSKIMGMDAVYVHMVDSIYKKGEAFWVTDDAALYRIVRQADVLRPILLGKVAPNIVLQDSNNIDVPLYSVNAKYTIILFWNGDCGHCKKEMPKLVKYYPDLKQLGAEVYSVYAEEEWDKWKGWLKEYNYPWIDVGNMKLKSNYQALYNVDQTPLVYIINSKKEIIAKKIGMDQLIDFLKNYETMEAGKIKSSSSSSN